MTSITLTDQEIAALCPGLSQPAARVRHLRNQGFTRARRCGDQVILERAHYEAVCRGQFAQTTTQGYHPRITSLQATP